MTNQCRGSNRYQRYYGGVLPSDEKVFSGDLTRRMNRAFMIIKTIFYARVRG